MPPQLAPPEENQLVRVRGRHWVVSEVQPNSLGEPQHLVDLTSVEDDDLSQDLTIVWEVEPEAHVLRKETFPTPQRGRFDEPERLAAFLDAVRWGAVNSADSRALQAPFRSGITIEDYQLDPVVRALSMPRVNLLIADDVGLGKTIEAGLVMQELLLRHRARSVIVVCPASLCVKWQAEMAQKFGLEFRIVDAELVRRLRRERGLAANPWRHFPRLIVSIDWLKRPRAMSLFREILPADSRAYPRAFDLLVIDEVHTVAPAGRGQYALPSQRTRAIRELAPHFEHRLYLSATPHNGYFESWTALLAMLDPQRFAPLVPPAPEAVRQVMVRRLKSELREDPNLRRPDGSPRFAERRIVPLEVDYSGEERAAHDLLERYAASRRKSSGRGATRAGDFIALLLKKRLFSSPIAFAKTLEQHRQTLAQVRTKATGDREVQAAFDLLEDDVADDDELDELTEDALATAAGVLGGVTKEQEGLLGEMSKWAAKWQHREDAKTARLLAFVDEVCRPVGRGGGKRRWNDERIIVFTEYRDTQNFLFERLAAHLPEGEVSERVLMLYGGMDEPRRERIKAEFQAHPSKTTVRILLATDAASEGIDLQLHCHRLVHMETPFSPARMEQRNGRFDRHGQSAPAVLIHHFVGKGWDRAAPGTMEGDLGFLLMVARKLEQVREDLGNVGPLLADQVERRMLGDARATVDVKPDARRTASAKLLKIERNLRDEVRRLASAVCESRDELGMTPAAIERVVRIALERARQAPLAPRTLDRPSDNRRPSGPVYAVGQLTGSWARTVLDLPDPITGEPRPITFDHAVAEEADDVVLAHLNHPLVASSMRLLRAAIWDTGDQRSGLSRVTARVAPDDALGELVAVVHARLVITGEGGARLHEEIIHAGGRIVAGRFSREGWGVSRVAEALAAATEEMPPAHVVDALVAAWEQIEGPLRDTLRVRGDERAASLERRLEETRDRQVADMRAVLTELARSIKAELDDPKQLELNFPALDGSERSQLDRDVEALRARVAAIPAEIDAEAAEIRRRYERRTVRLFPAAVTFLVPRRLCMEGLDKALGAAPQRRS
jgi:superfamily II DNA or RNA helicase